MTSPFYFWLRCRVRPLTLADAVASAPSPDSSSFFADEPSPPSRPPSHTSRTLVVDLNLGWHPLLPSPIFSLYTPGICT